MAYPNYESQTLRASALSAGTSGQDPSTTLPLTTRALWVTIAKTTEAAADNLLTVRLQCYVNSAVWVDVPYTSIQLTGALATAADTAAGVTSTPNILDADSTAPSYTIVAHYEYIPTNVVRTVWVSSGTAPAHTFSCVASYVGNQF